eukprot:376641_1
MSETLLWSLIGSVLLIICIVLLFVLYRWKLKRDREKLAIYVKNPMVICIAIGYYSDSLFDTLDLGIDIENVAELFQNTLNYQLYPPFINRNNIKLKWNQKELIKFLFEKAKQFDESNHDGLIVVLTGHGMKDYIITSDIKAIAKVAIHRIFSHYYPRNRNKPRLFIFDSCDGNNERNNNQRAKSQGARSINDNDFEENKDDNENIQNYVDGKVIDLHFIENLSKSEAWNKYEHNPDYRLC